MRIRYRDGRYELLLLWKCKKHMHNRFIMLPFDENGKVASFSHRLLGKFYNTDNWIPPRVYSQWVTLEGCRKNPILTFVPVLYDTYKGTVLLPENQSGKPVVVKISLEDEPTIALINDYSILTAWKDRINEESIRREGAKFFNKEIQEAKKLKEYNFNSMPWEKEWQKIVTKADSKD